MNSTRGRYLGTLDYYFKHFLDRLIKPGSSSAIPMPSEFLIDTGNVCNLRCPFCPTGIGRTGAPKGLMSLRLGLSHRSQPRLRINAF